MDSELPNSVDWSEEVTVVEILNITSDFHSNKSNCSNSCSTAVPEDSFAEVERIIRIVIPVAFGIMFLLGLFGNTLVILVVSCDKNMRNTTNILILMLALADLLFIVFCVPFTATSYATPVWPFGKVWCKVENYLTYVSAYASVYTLVLMSLDRYLAVVHAIRSMSLRTENNTWLAVGVVWAIILLSQVHLLLEYDVEEYPYGNENRTRCVNMRHVKHNDSKIVFHSCFLTFGYILPLGAVCLMYGLMLRRLHGKVIRATKSQESIRAKRRVTKMVVIIVIVFAICWLPIQVILLVQSIDYRYITLPVLIIQLASNCLAYMNSCVNPIFYAFLSENFRRSFKKLLCCSSPMPVGAEYELVSVKQTENMSTTAVKSSI